MQQTTNLGLNKPDYNDTADIGVINSNMDIIDEKITELQSGSGVKIYTTVELANPQENKIYNVKIEENTSTINEKPVYKENTTESVTLKAGKVATVYYQGGNFFYKASASGDAVAENVLAGKKFSNDDGTDIVGTMENHGGKVFKPSTANIIISKGFHNGTGYVEGDPDLVSRNIVSGKQIFGVDGNALTYTQSEKTAIANAITSKGVPTSTTASFEQMALNIRNIKQGTASGRSYQFSTTGKNGIWQYPFKAGQLVGVIQSYISGAIQILNSDFQNNSSLVVGVFYRRGSGILNFQSDSIWAMGLYYIPTDGVYTIYKQGDYHGDFYWGYILNG